MNSEAPRLHVAIFPSVWAIANAQGKDWAFNRIEGRFSRNLFGKSQTVVSRFIKSAFSKYYEQAIISWKVEQEKDGKLATIGELLQDLKKNGIGDMAIKEITFVVQTVEYNNYTMQNEKVSFQWTFHPFTFRPGTWKRLKASERFPGRRLYLQILAKKRALKIDSKELFKRWKDCILINDKEEHANLENYEIRSIWGSCPFAMLLKETKDGFELMDIGEWKL